MKKFSGLFFGLLLANILLAQMPTGRPGGGQQITGRFYGKVVDASKKGVEAASVTLVTSKMDTATKKPKEVIVGGMLTTKLGDFSVENVPLFGRYKIRITGIGYKSYEQAVQFEMPNRNAGGNDPSAMLGALDKDLGNIKLEIDNQVLGGVTVTASKPMLQLGFDRKVFNVDKNLVSVGGSAVDVMKNVPSVNVDIDGNVSLRNAAPQIFVDGRPTNLTLEQIPADAIESVEIITNPSAKFDASGGTAGILNIVLKKNKRVGYSGNVRFNVDSRGKVGGGGDINIRQNKVNFFASGMYNQRKSIGEGVTDRITKGIFDTTYHSVQNENSTAIGAFGFGRAGFDYFIDNRNTITISGSMVRGGMDPNSVSDITIDSLWKASSYGGSIQKRFVNSDNLFRNLGTQLNFKHNFPKAGHEWTADVTYNKGKNESNTYTETDSYDQSSVFKRATRQRQAGSGENENLILQTDYVKPINDKSKYELGLRSSTRTVNSANKYFYTDSSGFEYPAVNQNINYTSKDHVYAAYATYTNRIKNFGYQLGLRAESSKYEGNLPDKKDSSFTTDYPISLFPSVFLSNKINENNELQLNYSRRINRPGFWQLFPFIDISDPLNISQGNPALKPEFTNSLELSYSKIFKNRDNFITSLYFKNTNNLITRFQEPRYVDAYKDTFLVTSYINANSSYVTGLELTGKNKISKWWDLTSNINLFTSKIDLENQPDPDQFVSYFLKINNTFKLPKNFTLQLSGDYTSKIISSPGGSGQQGGGRGGFGGGGMFGGGGVSAAQGYVRPQYGVDAGIRFEFLKDKTAAISLNVSDIFRTRKYSAYSSSDYFTQDSWRRRDPQMARLNFSWRFGKFDAALFKRKDTKADSNVNMENANF